MVQAYGVALVENTCSAAPLRLPAGGKFANGAITGAFGDMFNAMGGRIVGGVIRWLLEVSLNRNWARRLPYN